MLPPESRHGLVQAGQILPQVVVCLHANINGSRRRFVCFSPAGSSAASTACMHSSSRLKDKHTESLNPATC